MTVPIIIEHYDPDWPEQFEAIRSRVAVALADNATAIEHIGSTAVPGLAAKRVIDLDVLLRSSSDLPVAIEKLNSLGYEHRGDLGIPGRDAFRPPPDDFPHHLYVCSPEFPEFKRHIAFRNYLRSHPEDANTYAALKRALAERNHDNREAYTNAKSEFVARILRQAQAPIAELSPSPPRILW